MRRAFAVGLVALGLAAAGCGAAQPGDHYEVSSGPRPDSGPVPLPSPGLRPSARLGSEMLAALAPATGPGYGLAPADPSGLKAGPAVPDGAQPQPAGPPPPGFEPAGPPPPGSEPAGPSNVFAATISPGLSPAVADIPVRAYVPNSDAHTLTVIDPVTFEVLDRIKVGTVPHHVTPSWDLSTLYVNNTASNTLTVIDPRTGKVRETLSIVDPYNLYFTPDGTKAIVVAERFQRLDYRNPHTWELIKSVPVPWAGVDHLDFSADGRYLLASCEFTGQVVKIDNETMEVVGRAEVGSLPIDIKVSPDGSVFFVANQGRHGVSVIDPETMTEIDFLPTGRGAHGLNYSRDTTRLFVSNRLAGTISVIDVASRRVAETWKVGGSPDMLQVTADGKQLWVSNRFHGSVSVIDTSDGSVIKTIPTGAGAHGVALFPQPGRFSVGHNGVFR
jgi:YVTN family beta-propeller protein